MPLYKSLLSAVNVIQNTHHRHVSTETLWHQRLGHISISRMKMLSFLPNNFELSQCSICLMSKQTRTIFSFIRLNDSSTAFYLIHIDVWGPFNTPTYNRE